MIEQCHNLSALLFLILKGYSTTAMNIGALGQKL